MESNNKNNNLWKRNPQYRDDGTISIGSYFRVLSPLPINNLMANDIPMLETRFPVIALCHATNLSDFPVNMGIPVNTSKAFVLTGCHIDVISSTPEETRCSGLFCDKQRIHEIMENNQGCGCYAMLSRRSNLVMDHSLNIKHSSSNFEHFVERFSSNKFSMFYQSSSFPSSLQSNALQMTDEFFNYVDQINNAIQIVNEQGGWNVVGWYKRGQIDDKSILQSEKQKNYPNDSNARDGLVDSGTISFHICQIRPTKCKSHEFESLGAHLVGKKYDVSRLSGFTN